MILTGKPMGSLPSDEPLSTEEVASLLRGVSWDSDVSKDDWAAAMDEQAKAEGCSCQEPIDDELLVGVVDGFYNYDIGDKGMSRDGSMSAVIEDGVVRFSVMCGDWVYPYKNSISPVQYSIDEPLVLMLFPPKGKEHEVNKSRGGIDSHFNSKRRLHCSLHLATNTVALSMLTNDEEPDYTNVLGFYSFAFDPNTLDRKSEFTLEVEKMASQSQMRWSIFLASVLLQNYLERIKDCDSVMWGDDFIYFRKATIAEIESIGRW